MRYYVADAFTDRLFTGNPAGVCLPGKELPDVLMQSIAAENNLAETAFVVKRDDGYGLRWFTPETEIDLCGHATLASAWVLWTCEGETAGEIRFHTRSGVLTVTQKDGRCDMDFPARPPEQCERPAVLERALGVCVRETHASRDLLALVQDAETLRSIRPDFTLLESIKDFFSVVVTAKGDDCDFVSRFFAPGAGIPEDPVTGSSHSTLIPFWSKRLHKTEMTAMQLSKRGGILYCRDIGSRVMIGGFVKVYLKGEIIL